MTSASDADDPVSGVVGAHVGVMTLARPLTLSLVVMTTLASAGCFWTTSKTDGDELRRTVRGMHVRLETKEKTLAAQIDELQKVFDDASQLLARNSKDLGNAIAELRSQIRETAQKAAMVRTSVTELNLGVAAMRTRIDRVEVRIAQAESGKATARSSPEELWTLASQAFEVKRYKEAMSLFERLAETFPTHARADDAMYFRGQSFGHLAEWNRAIAAYQRLRTMYPDSALADDALYFAALAAKELKNCTEARTYLAILKSKYSKTNVTSTAQQLDAQLRRDAKKRSVCAS